MLHVAKRNIGFHADLEIEKIGCRNGGAECSYKLCRVFDRISVSSFLRAVIFKCNSSLASLTSCRSFRAFARLLRMSEPLPPHLRAHCPEPSARFLRSKQRRGCDDSEQICGQEARPVPNVALSVRHCSCIQQSPSSRLGALQNCKLS